MSSSPNRPAQPNGNSVHNNPHPDSPRPPEQASSGSLGQGSPSHPPNPNPPPFASFSDALRFGVESHNSPLHLPAQRLPVHLNQPSAPLRPLSLNGEPGGSSLDSTPAIAPLPESSEPPSNMDDLMTLCLLAKLWGETLPLPLIITKTKFE